MQNSKKHKSKDKDSRPSPKGWEQLKALKNEAAKSIQSKFPNIWTQIKAKNYEVHLSPLVRATFTGLVLEQSVIDQCKRETPGFNSAAFLNRPHYTIYKALQEIPSWKDAFRHFGKLLKQDWGPSRVGT